MLKVEIKYWLLLKKWLPPLAAVALLVLFLWWQSNGLMVTRYTFSSIKIPQRLQGFCIVQISDLHNKEFGGKLIEAIKQQNPHLIVITGDIISRDDRNAAGAEALISQAAAIAPIYYVTGNHEAAFAGYPQLARYLDMQGVTRLDHAAAVIEHNGEALNLIGLLDPAFYTPNGCLDANTASTVQNQVAWAARPDLLNIVLTHRPSLIESYEAGGADLVLAGHAHGGQIRLPFIGALIAPDEGFFPRYTGGMHQMQNTTMVISRGIGNSKLLPIRLFNRPELVVIRLDSKGSPS